MAIDKVEKKTYEFSKPAVIQLAVAAGLVILSIPVGWFAFSNWRFKSALTAGYQLYESNQVGQAKNELESAVSWKSDHIGARQVLAKILCDAGANQLPAAEEQLKRVQSLGGDSPDVRVAMGVVYLKRAEAAKAQKEIVALIDAAGKEFDGAKSVEGAVGLGHCELLLANKLGDSGRLQSAKKRFEAIRDDLSKGRRIAAGGLIDFYSGLGTALAGSDREQDLKDARDAFQACAQLAPRWEVPRANLMTADARRWALWKGTAAEISASAAEVEQKRKAQLVYWRDNRDRAEKLARPWTLWTISFAQAFSRAGNDKEAARIIGELKNLSQLEAYPDAWLADAIINCEMAVRPNLKPNEMDSATSHALGTLDSLLKKHLSNPTDDISKDRRARALNAMAVMRFMQGAAYYKQAEDFLGEALKLYPDDYMYNRNLVIVLKRAKAPTAKIQGPLDKAKAAAASAPAGDFENVQRVLEEK